MDKSGNMHAGELTALKQYESTCRACGIRIVTQVEAVFIDMFGGLKMPKFTYLLPDGPHTCEDYGAVPCRGSYGVTCTCAFGHCNMEDPRHKKTCSASEMCNCFCPVDCDCWICTVKR